MIEEAAGLGKHRKRRRRAQLKLERTEENLSRALDVEREARSHLRPLKRQAEAAGCIERIERQSLEARLRLAGDDVRAACRAEERGRGPHSTAARSKRDEAERLLAEVARRREAAGGGVRGAVAAAGAAPGPPVCRSLGGRADRHPARAGARPGAFRAERRERRSAQLALLEEQLRSDGHRHCAGRISELEAELAGLEQQRERRQVGPARRPGPCGSEQSSGTRLASAAAGRGQELGAAEEASEQARSERRVAERAAEETRARAARAGAALADVERMLRAAAPVPRSVRALARDRGRGRL